MDSFDFLLVMVFVVIICIFVGCTASEIGRANTTEEVCESLGFDGQIEVNSERFCYTACPFDSAISGECVP